jgi:hypothetical protein
MLEQIASCRLDLDGLRAQRDRYSRLGTSVIELERKPGCLSVRFGAALDAALLEETINVENGCCPFFSFEYDPIERLLRIGVERDEQDPALDALVFALGQGGAGTQPACSCSPESTERART